MTNLDLIREKSPLIICLTNNVVQNFTANGLVSLGASPAMSTSSEDLKDLLKFANALLVNIGTVNNDTKELYKQAVKYANEYGVPVVLDPVAVGASGFRKNVVEHLLNNYKIDVVRGNAGEIASLINITVESKGVDSGSVDGIENIALKASKKLNTAIVLTGEKDAIAVNNEVITLANGSSLMPKVIGTGCLLGAVVASFINLGNDEPLINKLEEALSVYNIAGEIAESRTKEFLPGTYQIEFLNALHLVSNEDILNMKKVVKNNV